jgi:Flp pilus assembly pilin Flp
MDPHAKQILSDHSTASIEFGLIATGTCVALVTAALTVWAWVFI